MDKLERFKAAARECARPRRHRKWPALPWWVRGWFPMAGVPWRSRFLYLRLRFTGKL
jgi:hypothetical protein